MPSNKASDMARSNDEQQMTVAQLRTTHQAGGILAASLIPHGCEFYIAAEVRTGGRAVLIRRDRHPRLFKDPTTALRLLRDMGFASVSVDLASWNDRQPPLTP